MATAINMDEPLNKAQSTIANHFLKAKFNPDHPDGKNQWPPEEKKQLVAQINAEFKKTEFLENYTLKKLDAWAGNKLYRWRIQQRNHRPPSWRPKSMQHLPKDRIKSWPKSMHKGKHDADSASPRDSATASANGKRARIAANGTTHDVAVMLIAGMDESAPAWVGGEGARGPHAVASRNNGVAAAAAGKGAAAVVTAVEVLKGSRGGGGKSPELSHGDREGAGIMLSILGMSVPEEAPSTCKAAVAAEETWGLSPLVTKPRLPRANSEPKRHLQRTQSQQNREQADGTATIGC